MKTKQFAVRIKAAGANEGTPDGVFEALAATYDLDSVGDKIVPGAFSETLVDWSKSGDSIPLYWSHRMDDPHMNIGHVLDSRETADGLWVKGQLDLETPAGAQVYRLLKGRRVRQLSFAYDVEEGAFVEESGGDGYYELRKLKLHEVSIVPVGANQNTEVLAVKNGAATVNVNVNGGDHDKAVADAVKKELDRQTAATAEVAAKAAQILADKDTTPDAKAGRSLSAKNEERVRDIARLAKELLDSVAAAAAAEADSDEGKTSTTTETSASSIDAKATTDAQPATSEEPAGAKDATPARPGPASLRLLADLDAMCVEAY